MSAATYDIEKVADSEIEDGARAEFTGHVYFPDHVDHDPEGDELKDENDELVLLSFEVDVYMPTDSQARETTMQGYADSYQTDYWQAVADGHRA